MRLYPNLAPVLLEFNTVQQLLGQYCKTTIAAEKAASLRLHTKINFIELELQQAHEFKLILQHGQYFPIDCTTHLQKEIQLLSIQGSTLLGEDFLEIRSLAYNIQAIFRWFDTERRLAYPALTKVIENSYFEKNIITYIEEVIDDTGNVKDNASADLQNIRIRLWKKRNELRRVFEKVLHKLSKAGYTADIEESFSSGRRVVAVFSEHKRQVKGIFHGESDSRKTAFIEPEETIDLNNEVYALENEERAEVKRILKQLTANLSSYAPLLLNYLNIIGLFDFIKAKALLAMDMHAEKPDIIDKSMLHLQRAYHPILFLNNQKSNKPTIPVNIELNDEKRILIISGPNAGGKTVTMKTVGLIQLMVQSGLLVPVHPHSQIGIFKQLFILMGDTQSIEFELSTYSSHLLHLKHFIEMANGRTLFFIDELGSGSDPNLGGAFAEVIMEELCRKHSIGIVTTHYLNLKIMGNKTPGIVNGAMAFDEKKLEPLYQLMIGKPGSSYTFAIAERIGLPIALINRARKLVDEQHFKLDKLLNNTEQHLQQLHSEKIELKKLLKENADLKKELEATLKKEKHKQQIELLKHQNKLSEEKLAYLKNMERKLKQIVLDYKKAEDKNEVIKNLKNLLFQKNEIVQPKQVKKINHQYKELNSTIKEGMLVKLKKNYQVGTVKEIRGKRAIVQVGLLPMNIELSDLVAVEKQEETEKNQPK
ncbi:endonuclease MutS2 [Hydrotalea sandarakina]|jgi:DNA mismatch repair protein MutS2|uniref:DNA mismatch repair protein MutS2 n=1 Tax=Hydrotalea sandarakina TaxID=1004304 RepID=A0A2W7SFC5_9BACT|nr:MutS2/Smr-associated SH3 domain-containing protein [Hydrotalea sandarakina]PZX65879.1 DNA mismatch repair protein MutS2 [Hydrotalea sandarakina]